MINREEGKVNHFKHVLFAAGLILVLHFISSLWVLEQSSVIRVADEFERLRYSYFVFAAGPFEVFKALFSIQTIQCHPEFFASIGGLLWKLLNPLGLYHNEAFRILLPNIFFFGVLLFSVYGTTLALYKDRRAALLALLLAAFTPVIFASLKVYMIDFPLCSMVALAFFCLLKTDGFKSLTRSLVAAAVFALGQLTKETFFVFVFPAALLSFILAWSKDSQDRKKTALNFLFFILVFISICFGPYYASHGVCFKRYLDLTRLSTNYSHVLPVAHVKNYLQYIYAFIWSYFYPAYIISLFPLFVFFLVKIKWRSNEVLLFVLFFVPLVLFSASPNKITRFMVPVVPVFVIMATGGLCKSKALYRYYPWLLFAVALLQWGVVTYYPSLFNYYPSIRAKQLDSVFSPGIQDRGITFPVDTLEGDDRMIDDLAAFIRPANKDKIIVFALNRSAALASELHHRLFFGGKRVRVFAPFLGDCEIFERKKASTAFEFFKKADYLILGEAPLGGCSRRSGLYDRLKENFETKKDEWRLLGEFRFNSRDLGPEVVSLYERKNI